jgi:hypothetical protein
VTTLAPLIGTAIVVGSPLLPLVSSAQFKPLGVFNEPVPLMVRVQPGGVSDPLKIPAQLIAEFTVMVTTPGLVVPAVKQAASAVFQTTVEAVRAEVAAHWGVVVFQVPLLGVPVPLLSQ